MTCPVCGGKTGVCDSRAKADSIYRRRRCLECDYRFNTLETEVELHTIKKKVGEALEDFKIMLYAALDM